MSILDLNVDDRVAAASRYVPQPAKQAKTSVWQDAASIAGAPIRGGVEALAEGVATAIEWGGAPFRRGLSREVNQDVLQSDYADSIRNHWRQYRPDPGTATTAEQILYGFARGATKIVGAAAAAGVPGIVAAGFEEANTQADELKRQGVDLDTRTAAGLVQGAGLAAAALPLVGQTKLATAALYAAGGPGGFMAQQALTREILQGAGYETIGAQYDPFDPVGLAVASLIPAAFTAYGLRQQRIARAVDSLPDLPRPAVEPPAAPAPEFARTPIAEAVARYPSDLVDAARVAYLQGSRAATGLGRADDWRAADRHEAALARAEEQIAAGEPVSVASVIDAESRALVAAWDRVHAQPIGPANDPLVRLMPEDVRSVIVERGPVELRGDGVTIKVPGYGIVKFIWKHGPESRTPQGDQVTRADLEALPTIMREFEPDVRQVGGTEQLTWVAEREDGARIVYGTTRFVGDGDHHLVTMHVDSERKLLPSVQRGSPQTGPGGGALQASPLGTADRSFSSSRSEPVRGQGESVPPAPEDVAPASEVALGLARQQFPDLTVQLDGMDAPMRLDDFMAAVKAEADELAADAPLMEVAAQCAIVNGTGS